VSNDADHLAWAQQHVLAGLAVADVGQLSWATVAYFYAAHDLAHAVFAIESGLRAEMRHPDSHTGVDLNRPGTNTVIKRHFPGIERPYMSMYATSLGVRYQGQQVSESRYLRQLAKLDEVKAWARRKLAENGCDVPTWLEMEPVGPSISSG
jgi:hypothetical protein